MKRSGIRDNSGYVYRKTSKSPLCPVASRWSQVTPASHRAFLGQNLPQTSNRGMPCRQVTERH